MAKKIKNVDGDFYDVEVIRYFVNNDIEYLIYSLNEIDNNGYTKLYASKIVDSKACIITDNDEWNLIKEIIKEIVRSNRDGSKLNVVDLNENNLDYIELQDTRVFKLQGNLVNLLSENKKIKVAVIPDEELDYSTIPEEPDFLKEEVLEEDYEELYKKELEKNKELKEQLEELNKTLEEYNKVFNKIKEIVG